jgi:hypothetical protein
MNYDAVWRIFIIFLTLTAKCVTRVNVDGGENAGKPPDAHLVHPFEKCPARFAPALAARSKLEAAGEAKLSTYLNVNAITNGNGQTRRKT